MNSDPASKLLFIQLNKEDGQDNQFTIILFIYIVYIHNLLYKFNKH